MSSLEITKERSGVYGETNYDETITNASDQFKEKTKGAIKLFMVAGTLTIGQIGIHNSGNIRVARGNSMNIEQYEKNTNESIADYAEIVNAGILKNKFTKNDIVKEIISFRTLGENWDGYGAYPLEVESAANALELIEKVGADLFCRVEEIYPNPNGTISFEWLNNSDETFSLEVGNAEMSYYLDLASTETKYNNRRPIDDKEAEKISDYIKLL